MFMRNGATAASVAVVLANILFSRATAQMINAVSVAESIVDAHATVDSDDIVEDAVRQLTEWVIASDDNNGMPFIVIDKITAKVFAFNSQGQLVGATPALLGAAVGDDSAPDIGTRKLSAIDPDERTTPAGRFVAKIGTASGNHEVLWVDYATAVSLHPVVTTNKKERRLQRLQSPSFDDNRITYGCINVPASFYSDVVRPLLTNATGIVYILPETKAWSEVFLTFHAQEQPSSRSEVSH